VGFLGWRGIPGASEEGGFEELLKFCLSRASSSATRAVSASTTAIRLAMTSSRAATCASNFLRDARVSGIHLHHALATPRHTSSCLAPRFWSRRTQLLFSQANAVNGYVFVSHLFASSFSVPRNHRNLRG
jgi:hypothetical protein